MDTLTMSAAELFAATEAAEDGYAEAVAREEKASRRRYLRVAVMLADGVDEEVATDRAKAEYTPFGLALWETNLALKRLKAEACRRYAQHPRADGTCSVCYQQGCNGLHVGYGDFYPPEGTA